MTPLAPVDVVATPFTKSIAVSEPKAVGTPAFVVAVGLKEPIDVGPLKVRACEPPYPVATLPNWSCAVIVKSSGVPATTLLVEAADSERLAAAAAVADAVNVRGLPVSPADVAVRVLLL